MDFLDNYFQVSDGLGCGLGNTLCHEWNTSLLLLSSCLELLEVTHDTLQHLRLVIKCGMMLTQKKRSFH